MWKLLQMQSQSPSCPFIIGPNHHVSNLFSETLSLRPSTDVGYCSSPPSKRRGNWSVEHFYLLSKRADEKTAGSSLNGVKPSRNLICLHLDVTL
jgi:hypothetical protein